MVTTNRKFELIIRSRASASPFLIFPASSTSCCGVKRGIRPISRRYLFSPVSLLFMTGTYSTERIRRYCARVGFSNNTREVIGAPPFEIEFGSNLVAFAVAIFLVGLLSIASRLEKSAYHYASITLTIIVLIPRSAAPWIIALHRFLEVSVGIIVALALVALWPEHRRLSPNSAAE